MQMEKLDQNLFAKPIQLDLHSDICISFRADSFVVSFGDAEKFYEDDGQGAERYIEWLKGKIAKDPLTVVHIWQNDLIIGQIELGGPFKDSNCGYINLYYLIPSKRGLGIGKYLDQYAMEYFKRKLLKTVQLSVSPTNLQAVSYYKKMGWIDIGPRSDHPEVHLMEKCI